MQSIHTESEATAGHKTTTLPPNPPIAEMPQTAAQLPPRGPNGELPIPVDVIKEGLAHTILELHSGKEVPVFDVLEDTLAPIAGEGAMPWPKVIAVPCKHFYQILKETRLLDSTKAYLYNVDFLIDDFPTKDQNKDQNEDRTSLRDKLINYGLGEEVEHAWNVRSSRPEDVYQWALENANTNGDPCRKVIFTTIERVSTKGAWREGVKRLPESSKRAVILPSWREGVKRLPESSKRAVILPSGPAVPNDGTHQGSAIDVEDHDRPRPVGSEGNPITLA